MDGVRPDTLNDSQLDRELDAALGVEPSPEFLARVRTRVASEPQRLAWRLALGMRAIDPLWVVGLAGVVLTVLVPSVMREAPTQVRPAAVKAADTANEVEAGDQAGVVRQPIRTEAITPPLPQTAGDGVHTVPLLLSPVLFAEEDQRVFALFVAAAGEGRVPEDAGRRTSDSDEMEALTIAPLVIAPLPTLARNAREGEDQWE